MRTTINVLDALKVGDHIECTRTEANLKGGRVYKVLVMREEGKIITKVRDVKTGVESIVGDCPKIVQLMGVDLLMLLGRSRCKRNTQQ